MRKVKNGDSDQYREDFVSNPMSCVAMFILKTYRYK